MAGKIVGFYGFQRSGKTLLASILAEYLRKSYGIPVYTNMSVENWTTIKSISDIPFNFEPKICLLDEIYFSLDSRAWKDNATSSIFLNTIGKQEILFLYTAISPDMVEMRLRDQTELMFIAKNIKSDYIEYMVIDTYRKSSNNILLKKNEQIFNYVKYDTKQVPGIVKFDIDYEKFFKLNEKENDKKWNLKSKRVSW